MDRRRESALALETIQGNAAPVAPSCQPGLTPTEMEDWVKNDKRGVESAVRAKPEDVRDQYARRLRELPEGYGEAMLEIRAPRMPTSLLETGEIFLLSAQRD